MIEFVKLAKDFFKLLGDFISVYWDKLLYVLGMIILVWGIVIGVRACSGDIASAKWSCAEAEIAEKLYTARTSGHTTYSYDQKGNLLTGYTEGNSEKYEIIVVYEGRADKLSTGLQIYALLKVGDVKDYCRKIGNSGFVYEWTLK